MRVRAIGFIVTLVLGLFATPPLTEAQQAEKMSRIGCLSNRSPTVRDEAFFQGLRDLGWIEGQNIAIEYRRTIGNKWDGFIDTAEELIRLKVDVIVTGGRRRSRWSRRPRQRSPLL